MKKSVFVHPAEVPERYRHGVVRSIRVTGLFVVRPLDGKRKFKRVERNFKSAGGAPLPLNSMAMSGGIPRILQAGSPGRDPTGADQNQNNHVMKTAELPLYQRWQQLLASEPNLRIRDAAARLNVSEAELVATRVGSGITRLAGDWQEFVKAMPRLGRVMCLTRNESAVHERYGVFREIAFFGPPPGIGQVVGPDIDLRLFMQFWHIGFAVQDETRDGVRHSFQIFDASGTAVHKIYLQAESNLDAYREIVEQFRAEDQSTEQSVTPHPPRQPEIPDSEVDLDAYHRGYLSLRDTHDFYPLIRKHGLTREQSLRLAPKGYACRVEPRSIEEVLKGVSAIGLPIMIFVGNQGCLQIHTGPVKNIKWFGPEWLNVLDEEFNMHLRFRDVASVWVVIKPVQEPGVGHVTSLELYDAGGNTIALLFGKRKPGEPEDPRWRELTGRLRKLEAAV